MKKFIKSTFIYIFYRKIKSYLDRRAVKKKWEENGRLVPPPHEIKVDVVKETAKKFKTTIFVETGTYRGDMVFEVKNLFKKIISIELSKTLFEQAKMKFEGFNHITIVHGDSGEILGSQISNINEPCLFWLDGHYSAGITAKGNVNTPIIQELNHILSHFIKEHVILIDDARLFNGENDYPELNELRTYILDKKPNYRFEVDNDIIKVYKENSTKNK